MSCFFFFSQGFLRTCQLADDKIIYALEQAIGQIQTLTEVLSTIDPGAFTVTADTYATI